MADETRGAADGARKRGWLGSFVALFVGVPPVAVWAAEEEDAEERSGAPRD